MERPDFDAWWNYDKPAETEQRFRGFLPEAQRTGDAAYVAELRTQIARTLGLQRKFDEAHAMLDRVEPALPGLTERVRVRYLLERGRVLNSSGKRAEAIPLFADAFERASRAGLDFHAVDAAHMVAIAQDDAGRRMEWNLTALSAAEASADAKARGWSGSLYNNIGWDHFDAERYDEALAAFEKALAFRVEQGKPGDIRVARWCIAKTQRKLGRLDAAMKTQRALEREIDDAGEPDGYVFEEIGELLLATGRKGDSAPYFARAWEMLSKDPWLADAEPQRLQRLKDLGRGAP